MAPEAGEFSLIVSSVESANLAEVARQFAKSFTLDEQIASQICKSAPIIFATKLTKAEVKAIAPVLGELSKSGIDFRVTARVAGKLPKVNWPVRPQFTAGGSAGSAGLAFDWDNNAFVCPNCGESFLFRRLGRVKLAEPVAASSGNGSELSEPKAAVASKAQTAKIGAAAFSNDRPTAVGVEGVEPLAGEGESLDLPETVEEVNLDALPDAAPTAEPLAEAPAPGSGSDDLLPEAAPLAEEPLPEPLDEPGEFSAATEEPAAAPEPEPAAAEPEAPAVEAEPEAEAVPEGELYNVFLSKITDTSKRDKAADLISKVKGCSATEAKELTTRLVIPLAKNVPKAKAEDILNQFKKLKIFGRMTKVK
jgi:hypothetical protein